MSTRLKFIVKASDSGVWGDDVANGGGVQVIRSTEIGIDGSIDWDRDIAMRSLSISDQIRFQVCPGDILMVRSSGSDAHLGKAGFVDKFVPSVCFSNFIQRLRVVEECSARFVWYFLNSRVAKQQIRALSSTTTGLQNLSAQIIGELQLDLPPLDEQRRIADLLDAETSRIDRLASLQGQVLAKLQERESAQRDSVIGALEVVGGVTQLRRHIWSVDQGTSPQCDSIPAEGSEWGVLKVSCLRPGVFDASQNKRLPPEIEPDRKFEVRKGDLLIVRANTPLLVGSTAVVGDVRERLLLSDKIFRVRLSDNVIPEFVAEVAAGSRIRAMCAASSNGASQSMANIRFEEVKAWPVPNVDERRQRRFVDEMARNRDQLTEIRNAINRQIALLGERRQALITAAVTGQFDVTTASGRNLTQGV